MDSNLWTMATIIALTCLVVSQIKIWLGTAPVVRAIPLFLVAVVVAVGLALLANVAGYMPGDWKILSAQAILAAVGSGGLYNVINGSALQRMDITKVAPTTRGDNSALVDADKVAVDYSDDHTPIWPATILLVWIGTIFIAGCAFMNQQATQTEKLHDAKTFYYDSLKFFTFLRDQNVVTQKWINEQKHIFDDVELAYKVWEDAIKTGGDTKTAEQKFLDAANVLRRLREQYQNGPTTKPVAKVSEYDDRGNPRAGAAGPGNWGPMRSRAA